MGERSSSFRDIHLHKKADKYGRDLSTSEKYIFIRRRTNMGVRSSNLRQIHLHKKADKYGREIYQLQRNTSS